MSEATTGQHLPGATQQSHTSSNGQQRKRAPAKKRLRTRAARPPTRAAGAALPGAGGMPQPLPEHRLPRLVTKPIANGIAAQTSAYVAFRADFVQSLLRGTTAPSDEQCEDWINAFTADLKMVRSSIGHAA